MSGSAAASNFKTFKELLITRRGQLLVVQINRPAVQNALRRRTINELLRALDIANADEGISVICLTGNATAFTSGNDLTELHNLQRKSGDDVLAAHLNSSNFVLKALVKKMLLNRKVVIALVQGNCVGMGVVIAALCDIIYATETAQFWLPFSQLGLCAEGGASWTLPHLLGRTKATELLLFGERLDAQSALRHGMVASLVLDEQEFWTRMEQHSQLPIVSLMATKRLLQQPWRQQVLDALDAECSQLNALRRGPIYRAQFLAFARRSKLSKL
ncbi:enoyl-CoA delta isomerase 2 [Drosophila grimshawi]|uniref:GH11876 n=1 Tax=Drosophila grimshawi TaxID=7222 RepID=B4JLG4_DROGR|nr:enoyl-CoA delta isomerase 2 [Drosophila grimshawi]EDW00417.1 GH11876 [Drosophila grimshawi]